MQKFDEVDERGQVVYAKVNIASHLERELEKFRDTKFVINLGGATDAYQESEKTAKIMPKILKLMIKYKNPIVICTKSDLILRDMDLINELSELTRVNIATSISSVDEVLSAKIEPGAPSPIARLNMIREFSRKTSVMTGIHLFPILPGVTEGYELLEKTFESIHLSEPDYLLLGTLYFNRGNKNYYLNQVKNISPELFSKTIKLYQTGKLDKNYKTELYQNIDKIKNEYEFKLSAEEAIKWLRTGVKE